MIFNDMVRRFPKKQDFYLVSPAYMPVKAVLSVQYDGMALHCLFLLPYNVLVASPVVIDHIARISLG